MKKTILSLILVLNFSLLQSQSFKNDLFSIATHKSSLENLRFNNEVKIDPKTFFINYKHLFGLTEYDSMVNYKVNHFEGGHTVYRFDQYYKGIMVWGSEYLLHQDKNGKIFLGNGHVGSSIQLKIDPKIDNKKAIELAIKASICKTKPWEVNDINKYTRYPKSELLIYNPSFGSRQITNTYYLAYKVDIKCDHSESIFIDATKGTVIGRLSHQHECISTNVNTIFNGTQSVNTQYLDSIYYLIDDCQSAKLFIYDGSTQEVIKDLANSWTTTLQKQGATTLWGLKKTYDYFKNKWNYLSIDNLNGSIRCDLSGIPDYTFMDPSSYYMLIGQPSDINNSFSTLDYISHEFTHGVTYYTSGLIYYKESGALNESFSDIFGEIVEKDVTDTNDWLIGNQRSDGATRSLKDPTIYNHPNYYLGDYWDYGYWDYGGVHTNSGVQNHWFYLLSQGGNFTTGIGFQKSTLIAFKNLTEFLTENSNYMDARNQSINAAIMLYGLNSNEVCQVTNAWYEVGLGDACNLNACDSCHCASLIKSNLHCGYSYFSLYEKSFDSTVAMPSCNSTKTKDMWFKFVAEDTLHKISAELLGFDSLNKINPSLSIYIGCNVDSLLKCVYSYHQNKTKLEMEIGGLIIGKTYWVRFMDYHQAGDTVPKSSLIGLCVTHGVICPKPKDLKVDKSSQFNSYELSWNIDTSYYNFFLINYYNRNGSLLYSYTTYNPEYISYGGFDCDSSYIWEIQAECPLGKSEFSDPDTFIVDTCFYNLNSRDIISFKDSLSYFNGTLSFVQHLRLTGNPLPTKTLNVKYYLSKSPNGSTKDFVIDIVDITQIYNTNAYTVNYEVELCDKKLEDSTFYLFYIIDEKNYLYEDNELNNKGKFFKDFQLNCSKPGPDLSVGFPSFNVQNNNLNYSNVIMNLGNVKSNSFDASLYLVDPITNLPIYKIVTKNIKNIDVGDFYNFEYSIDLCLLNIKPEEYYIMLLADSLDEVKDKNLFNNFNISKDKVQAICDIDLSENISSYSYENGKATYTISVLNSGSSNSPPFKIGFYLSKSANLSTLDYKLGEVNINSVQASNTYDFSKDFYICNTVKPGKYFMGYIIDYDNQIHEINESNNIYKDSKSINVVCNGSGIIPSLHENEITLYPNPTNGIVYISNLRNKVMVNVYNIQGKMIKSIYTKESFSLEELSSGTYIIKLDEKAFKITKNK